MFRVAARALSERRLDFFSSPHARLSILDREPEVLGIGNDLCAIRKPNLIALTVMLHIGNVQDFTYLSSFIENFVANTDITHRCPA